MRKQEVPPPCDDSNCPGKPSRPPDHAKLEVLFWVMVLEVSFSKTGLAYSHQLRPLTISYPPTES